MILGIVFWLAICAVFDFRRREVPNYLTLPVLGGMLVLRIFQPDGTAFILAGILFLLGLFAKIPGGDAKGLMALSLYEPMLVVFALLGAGGLGLVYRPKKAPAYVGFLLGTIVYQIVRR